MKDGKVKNDNDSQQQRDRQQQEDLSAALAVAAAASAAEHGDLRSSFNQTEEQEEGVSTTLHDNAQYDLSQLQSNDISFNVTDDDSGANSTIQDTATDTTQNGGATATGEKRKRQRRRTGPRNSTASNQSLGSQHAKRRQINTCLPCKSRKVKCDREKPYCGQCKKSGIPEATCTWSLSARGRNGQDELDSSKIEFAHIEPANGRIEQENVFDQPIASTSYKTSPIAPILDPKLIEDSATKDRNAFRLESSKFDIENIDFAFAPPFAIVEQCMNFMESIQNHGIDLAIDLESFKIQLAYAFNQHRPKDLSFAALLYAFLALTVELLPVDQVIALGISQDSRSLQDNARQWMQSSIELSETQKIQERPNLNSLTTLLLLHQLQSSRGLAIAASLTLAKAIRMSQILGLDSGNISASLMRPNFRWNEDQITVQDYINASIGTIPEHVRRLQAYISIQDWLVENHSSTPMIWPSSAVELPAENGNSVYLLRHDFHIGQALATWKVKRLQIQSSTELSMNYKDDIATVDERHQSMQAFEPELRLLSTMSAEYAKLVILRSNEETSERCLEAAKTIVQARLDLEEMKLPIPFDKLSHLQQFTLEAAIMIVAILHQNVSLGNEALQELVAKVCKLPGFSNVRKLLTIDVSQQNGNPINGKDSLSTGLQGLVEKRLLPYGQGKEIASFWQAIGRLSHVFLEASG